MVVGLCAATLQGGPVVARWTFLPWIELRPAKSPPIVPRTLWPSQFCATPRRLRNPW